MSSVRLGLIGAGYWGRILARSILEVPGLELACVATTNAPALEGIVSPECRITSNWLAMLENGGIDGVIIAAPAAFHCEMACEALKRNFAAFVEKPLAMTVADAEKVVQCVEAAAGILHVDHTDLFSPAWRALTAHLSDIGFIRTVEVRMGGTRPARPDINPLWDWGPHPVAACIDLLGMPSALTKLEENREFRPDGLREIITFQMAFFGGVTAQIVTGNNFLIPERNITIIGEKGCLRYDDKGSVKLVSIKGPVQIPIPISKTRPLVAALTRFSDAIRAGEPSWGDARLGLAVVSVLASLDG